jgi:hypothetical protein
MTKQEAAWFERRDEPDGSQRGVPVAPLATSGPIIARVPMRFASSRGGLSAADRNATYSWMW